MSETEILNKIGQVADKLSVDVYAVGGFVRDMLMQKPGKDIDLVVVGDGPGFAKALAKQLRIRNIVLFERFQTAMLQYRGFQLEFVGARSENYLVHTRKPIVREAGLQDDLSRRDFTINAIAYGLNDHNKGQLIDPFDGRRDIERKLIRTPLSPEITFNEDPLRILRAIRFATRLQFTIAPDAMAALAKVAHRLDIISQERITDEFLRILGTDKPSLGFELMDQAGILPVILPEMCELKGIEQREQFHHKDVFNHTLKVVDNVADMSDKLELRLAALFHDIAKPATKRFVSGAGWTFHGHDEIGARMLKPIFKRMRIPNKMLSYVEKLVRLHLRPIALTSEEVTDSAVRRLLVQAGEEVDDLLILCRADITSGNTARVQQYLNNFDYVTKRMRDVEEKDRMRTFQSPVRGEEIMAVCGISAGPQVGKIKKMIEEAILDGTIPNEYDAAYAYLLKIKSEVV
ncbi:HD domain-containing protein [candidate division KSB1 bacterium]|nr:HD domain-containing protein [candidate division KSB1 bacterium]